MNIFNYESKFMQFMLMVADYIILNVLFIICCIPIFTIGAAQAGLYTGVRVLLDKDDDSSCTQAFFRGFKSGFGNITILWSIFFIILAFLIYGLVVVLMIDKSDYFIAPEWMYYMAPNWMTYIAIALCIILQSNLTLFHSKFGCTKRQLLKNVFYMCLGHPLRSIAVAIITWIPALVFLLYIPLFLQATLFWVCGCYTILFVLNTWIMTKPFDTLTKKFVEEYEEENGEIILEETPVEE
jgi:uncharacterized membrane protein YesL